tara:strand:+ start:2575 stop:3363 length:789 start_codon:yes stop_codon:yes gene_type:complete
LNELTKLDHPLITEVLFHPRKNIDVEVNKPNNLLIYVTDKIRVGTRLHLFDSKNPNLIYFHGNAELVSEYDEFSKIYKNLGINFIPVDYRGYGFSNGKPSFSTMISDSNIIFKYLKNYLIENNYTGQIFIMGRSLGSVSALEIAQNFQEEIDGIIIESGFAYIEPLFNLFGISPSLLKINFDKSLNHINKIKEYYGPLLVIHAKNDQIINFSEGLDLYDNSNSNSKFNKWVENAHHNNIIQQMGLNYFNLLKEFIYQKSISI